MTETTALMRIHEKDAPPGTDSYAAARAAETLELAAAAAADGGHAEAVPWDVIPHGRALAEREFEGKPPRAIIMLGTTSGGTWSAWYPPFPAPPVPSR